jgi:hypothetical protein
VAVETSAHIADLYLFDAIEFYHKMHEKSREKHLRFVNFTHKTKK